MLRTALSIFAFTLLATAAGAAPLLKSDIVVNAAVVTLGDMFDDAGLMAEQPLFRAPEPGTTGQVSLAEIDAALGRAGIALFDANGLESVRVSRAATIVDEAMLTQLIAADLAERGIITDEMSVDTLFARAVAPIKAEAVAEPASVVNLRYLPGSGAFTARFAIAGLPQPLDVSGSIELLIAVPHLAASLPAGTVLSPDAIQMRPVALKYVESTGVARLEDLVGKALLRQSREGMMLRAVDVAVPQLVAKNDFVTIYFRKGPMTLTVKGQAITGAAEGGRVQVLNLMSKRVINAAVLSAGAVEVTADPLALAGL
jgi:flagella basal body P-ring formation protein FlgA